MRFAGPALLIATTLLSACRAEPSAQNMADVSAAQQDGLPTTIATITTRRGAISLQLSIAASATEQNKGLSGRKELPSGTGMLFPFDPPRSLSFWMKDTLIPLDLIFVRTDGSIAAILPGKPNDLTPISTGEPASAVIEIGGGEAERLGIAPEDRVRWGDCASAGSSADNAAQKFCPE